MIGIVEAELSTIIAASTPLLFAALGELVVEKSGVLNLGIEGMMLVGAVVGFIVAFSGLPPALAIALAMLSSVALSWIFAFLTLVLRSNQVATGLALAIFGTGLSSLIGANYVGQNYPGIGKYPIPLLSDIPFIGEVLFSQDILVYLSFIILFLVYWFLYHCKAGLILRSIGENHQAAFSLGHRVLLVRFLAISFGGAMAGLGGAYMSLVTPHLWTLELTAGRGWIALALVVFAAWRPWRLLIGTYLFGAIGVLQYSLQSNNVIELPTQILAMMPYLITIIALVLISNGGSKSLLHAPASLGKPFNPL